MIAELSATSGYPSGYMQDAFEDLGMKLEELRDVCIGGGGGTISEIENTEVW